MKRQDRQLAGVCLLALCCCLGISAAAHAQNTVDLKVGDVLAAVGGGTYQVYDAAGDSLGSIVHGAGDTRGCANDSSYHPITTDLSDAVINRWNVDYAPAFLINNNAVISSIASAPAESLALDGAGNLYAGQPGAPGCVLKYDVSGKLVGNVPPSCSSSSALKGGTAWIDLSADATTVYFGNGSSKTVSQFAAACNTKPAKNCISSFGPNLGTVFGVRVLTPDAAGYSGGSLLAAAASQVALLDGAGNLVHSYTVAGEKDFEVLTLVSGGHEFAVGSPSSHKIYVFDFISGLQSTISTGGKNSTGPAGMCTYGLADAAQPQPQPASVLSCGGSGTATLQPSGGTTCNNFTSNTAAFNLPGNNPASQLKVTFPDLSASGSLTARVTTVNKASVPSDPIVISSNTLLPEGGNFICTPDGANCYVWEVEPVGIKLGTDFTYVNVSLTQPNGGAGVDANSRLLKNEGIDVTYLNGNADPAGRSALSVYSLNEFVPNGGVGTELVCPTGNGGYLSPVAFGQVYNFGRTVPFKFQVAASLADCNAGNFLTNLGNTAYLTLVQCPSNIAGSCSGPFSPGFAPATAVIEVSGNSAAPPVYNQDTNQYHLNIDSSNLTPGACYAAGTYAPAIQSISTAFCLTN
jgi:hypothetical protein